MQVDYQNGHSLLIGEGNAGWILTIAGPRVYVHPGEQYHVYMMSKQRRGWHADRARVRQQCHPVSRQIALSRGIPFV